MRRRPGGAALLLAVLGIVLAAAPAGARPQAASRPALQYELQMPDPVSHLFRVTITARVAGSEPVAFQMPAWSPGRYVIYDFARNVQDVSAADGAGRPLRVTKTDKQTWDVAGSQDGVVVFRYRVYANNLSGTFSQLNARHASINGASVFASRVGHKSDPIHLKVDAPGGWRIAHPRSRTLFEREFDFENYDLLVDSPMAISPNLRIQSFRVDGVEYRVVVSQFGEDVEDIGRYVADVERIVRAENALLGPPPDLDRYTFFVYFAPLAESSDGMEHLASTCIVRTHPLGSKDGYPGLLWVTAHEFFHLWNVKRIRPVELGPWDYTRENYTRSLWIAEGITSYYADLFLRRAGLLTDEGYYRALAEMIAQHDNTPGREVTSAEQASFDTWLYLATSPRQRTNASRIAVDYYNKGAVLGLLLDLEIRSRTGGRRSLDDVFRLLWSRFFVGETAATYYYKGRGYTGADFLAAVNEVSGTDFGEWFARYVSGTDEPDFATPLASVGLAFERERRIIDADYGVKLDGPNGRLRVVSIEDDGLAARAGLRRNDVIVRIGDSVATVPAARELFGKGTVSPVPIRVLRGSELIGLTIPPPTSIIRCEIHPLPNAVESDVRRRAWLTGS